MIKIEIKEGESIERALKRYKRKHRNLKIKDQIRERQHYTKPSDRRRHEIQKAIYKQEYLLDQEI